MPLVNLQVGIGLALIGLLAHAAWTTWPARAEPAQAKLEPDRGRSNGVTPQAFAVGLACLIGLLLGTLEIDRALHPQLSALPHAAMARQAGWSAWWSVYAIGLIAAGFAWRVALSRYAGLALLGVALAKVLFVDLAHLAYGYRVGSFLVVGLLLIVTSVAYNRLAARLGLGARGAAGWEQTNAAFAD